MISGAGSSQDGSLRAEKILKDDKRAAFDTIRTIAFDKLPGLSQHFASVKKEPRRLGLLDKGAIQ